MTTKSSSPRPADLVVMELTVPGSNQHGRVFLNADRLPDLGTELRGELASLLAERFIEEDDKERLRLAKQVVDRPTVAVTTYPSEETPQELHAYLRATEISTAPIFACVLVSTRLVKELVSLPPGFVMETATYQIVEGEMTTASIASAMQAWIARVWPNTPAPPIRVTQWPRLEEETVEEPHPSLEVPPLTLPNTPVYGARPRLDARDYPQESERSVG